MDSFLLTSQIFFHYYNNEGIATIYIDQDQVEYLVDRILDIPLENGIYQMDVCFVSKTEDYGCSDTLCKAIEVNLSEDVFVPNAFTPNANGVNDYFIPVFSNENIEEFDFRIYTRWGEEIFQSTDYKNGWNGSFQNQTKEGIYVWSLKYRYSSSLIVNEQKGHVALLQTK